MPREFGRAERLAEQVQREVGTALLREVKDPRLRGAMISRVDVSRDLSVAKVFVTVPAGGDVDAVMSGLNRARGFLRSMVAKEIRMRSVPELRFVYDDTLDEAERIDELLRRARERSAPTR